MEIFKVFIFFLLFTHLNAHISIQMDDGDFNQVADFLQTFAHGPIQPYEHSCILRNLKKFTRVFAQMLGVMVTLVASNLLTAKFSPGITPPQQQQQDTKLEISFASNASIGDGGDGFKNEFGCHNEVCWRSCYTETENEIDFWCYSSPHLQSREYKRCKYQTDCAPYWECLESCHGKPEYFFVIFFFLNCDANFFSIFTQVMLKTDEQRSLLLHK